MRKMVIDGLKVERWMLDDLLGIRLDSGYEVETSQSTEPGTNGAPRRFVEVNAWKGGDE